VPEGARGLPCAVTRAAFVNVCNHVVLRLRDSIPVAEGLMHGQWAQQVRLERRAPGRGIGCHTQYLPGKRPTCVGVVEDLPKAVAKTSMPQQLRGGCRWPQTAQEIALSFSQAAAVGQQIAQSQVVADVVVRPKSEA